MYPSTSLQTTQSTQPSVNNVASSSNANLLSCVIVHQPYNASTNTTYPKKLSRADILKLKEQHPPSYSNSNNFPSIISCDVKPQPRKFYRSCNNITQYNDAEIIVDTKFINNTIVIKRQKRKISTCCNILLKKCCEIKIKSNGTKKSKYKKKYTCEHIICLVSSLCVIFISSLLVLLILRLTYFQSQE